MDHAKELDVFAGIDWGNEQHAVSLVTSSIEVLEQFEIPNSPEGFSDLHQRLVRYSRLRGIAVESTRNMLLVFLIHHEYPLYLINPKMSASWRKSDNVSEIKTDARDGLVLALGLAFRHKKLPQLQSSVPQIERLSLLCEKECALIDKRTSLVQELKSLLKQYHPGMLDFFEDWTSPVAWAFLKRFPTAKRFVTAKANIIIAFLKSHRIGWRESWQKKVETRCNAGDWPEIAHEEIYQLQAQAIVKQLQALEDALTQFRKEIETSFKGLSQAKLFVSLPGAGEKLAPRLAVILGSPEAQHGGLQVLRAHTGIAPVMKQSGQRKGVFIRRMCNKRWRNTMHQFAWCSTRFCGWARAFYDYRKQRGDTNSTALRKLADKWLKIIFRMIETQQDYEEEKYLKSLQKNQSPAWKILQQKACG